MGFDGGTDINNRTVGRLSAGLGSFSNASKTERRGSRQETREEAAARINRRRDLSKVTVLPAREDVDPYNRFRKKRVAIYARVSTDGLSQVTSFSLQKKFYLNMVASRPDWELVAIYSDEGLTATTTAHREGLLRLIEDAQNGKFDMVITKSLSRLSRNLMDCMRIIIAFRKFPKPVSIYFESEKINSLDTQMDFTIHVLALVAQEESHKKSEAMLASYAARFGDGQYMKPDLLGYDSDGINELKINPEEARTLQLMYMMYIAGYTPSAIAEVLTELGRKTHTHIYKDGHVKEGKVSWSPSGIIGYLKNERRCGDVLAQKSYTLDFLSHETRSNAERVLNQYYATEQHDAIIHPDDFALTNRLIMANRGGWKKGIPELEILSGGALNGFVMSVPDWYGFDSHDYNRACLRAYGITEEALESAEGRIKELEKDEGIPATDFQHVYTPKQSDYFEFQDHGETDEEPLEDIPTETFSLWTRRLGDMLKGHTGDISSAIERLNADICSGNMEDPCVTESARCHESPYGSLDLSDCEDIDVSLCSLAGRSYATFDARGIAFSKRCLVRLGEKSERMEADICLEKVKIAYNPAERLLAVMLADSIGSEQKDGFGFGDPQTIQWSREKDGNQIMRRCSIKGLAGAVYDNMDWNRDYKYKVFGTILETAEGPALIFRLDDPIINVRIKPEQGMGELDTARSEEEKEPKKKVIHDGFDPSMFDIFDDDIVGQEFAAVLDEFEIGNGPAATAAKQIARSRVQYYDDVFGSANGNKVSIEDIGARKYEPEFIEQLLQKGIEPTEGWSYLEGLVVFRDDFKGFAMKPLPDPGSFGRSATDDGWNRIKRSFRSARGRSETGSYGWTVGLDIPSREAVEEAIGQLRAEAV